MNNILLIEKNKMLCNNIADIFQRDNDVYIVHNLDSAIDVLRNVDISLIIIGLEGPDALDLIKRIHRDSCISIIVLTSPGSEYNEIVKLEIGATDCIKKPIKTDILRAVVNNQLKKFNNLKYRFDYEKNNFYVNGKKVALNLIDKKMLRILLKHNGIVSKNAFTRAVWGQSTVTDQYLYNSVASLQAKLALGKSIEIISTAGFKWIADQHR
ncbi:MAG: hypothetical protein ATN31_02295 [Candidatus Epulonipiscioides saccharophilum]|nr:MAG: hypothetical protein ATN31_02295 [Epulopiscium sp. AS2M-Bin001]